MPRRWSRHLLSPRSRRRTTRVEDAAPKLVPSKEFAKPAVEVDTAIKAKDFATAETKLAVAEPLAKTDDDRYFVGIFHLQIASSKNDNDGVAKALDMLIPNPKTPTEALASYNNVRGSIALSTRSRKPRPSRTC